MTSGSNRRPTVLVVGGGYGGIKVAKALDDIAEVTLVDPKEAFVHNIAAWRALVEPEWLDRIFFPYERLLAEGRFVCGSAASIDGRRVTLASGETLEADYLVLATGSSYPFPAKNEEPDVASARRRVEEAHEALLAAERVLIIGAGPSGLELAGEIKSFYPDKQVTIADVADDILTGPYDEALRDELRRQLAALDVRLQLGQTLSGLPGAEPADARHDPDLHRGRHRASRRHLVPRLRRSAAQRLPRPGITGRRARRAGIRSRRRLPACRRGDERLRARRRLRCRSRHGRRRHETVRCRRGQHPDADHRRRDAHTYAKIPTLIAIPLGPEGGAGSVGDGLASAATISELKGRELGVANFVELFGATPTAT